ncbi:protein translocase subunit SecD [Demequina sp.]|uniref:protein translocase subunit SecD n=1 Tax=Demequina sp. TaxID=2050685 RepID=UPI0025BF02EB|nr:protein translocase subunit SecD [Demequina sp.]
MSSAVSGARTSLTWLASLLVVLFALLSVGVLTGKTSAAPGLGLDLAGGRNIILQAITTDGSRIDPSDIAQAVEIIRKRVDASGVAEAEIATQGDTNIIVSLPGNPDQATLDLVRRSAQLQFRPVLLVGDPAPVTSASGTVTTSPTPTPTPAPDAVTGISPSPSPSASAAGEAAPAHEVANVKTRLSETTSATPSPSPAPADPPAPVTPTNPSDTAWITDALFAQYQALDCFDPANLTGVPVGDPDAGFATCDTTGSAKYILGPVELTGEDLDTASAGPRVNQLGNVIPGDFEVRLSFNGAGGTKFGDTTGRVSQLAPPLNRFGILLDGVVISAPSVNEAITGGQAQITGNFTLDEAQQLANQLKFGALPLTLEVLSEQVITATKGAEELRNGLLAGLIGLLLVVIYTIFQYRALGAVTIGSLLVAGGFTYATIALLSWGLGYRLSLAGVAGLIVAIGITADSFIVYFERVKDELREGRSLAAAVEHGWKRARRTILASDAVSFLAALVLYMLAVGGVRGFAFTLGLVTIVDLIVVILFTHPVLALLARTKFFGEGHKFSGLDPRQLGRDTMYKGRGRVAGPETSALTLAERKAAKARSAVDTQDKE